MYEMFKMDYTFLVRISNIFSVKTNFCKQILPLYYKIKSPSEMYMKTFY